jgi:nicotinamide mononucleotide adenylyltransferase
MSTTRSSADRKKSEKTSEKTSPEKTKEIKETSEVSKMLTLIQKDLTEMKNELKRTIKDDALEATITAVVQKLLSENNKEREEHMRKVMDEKCSEITVGYNKKLEKMADNIESLEKNVQNLKECLAECKKELRVTKQNLEKTEHTSREALRLANYNEQFSRKNNFKIMGIPEKHNENTWGLVKDFMSKVSVQLDDREVIAVHRIPGKDREIRPIIVKVLNPNVKARIMRKRSEVKNLGKGKKLVDDVTKANSGLISELTKIEEVDSAWYFNGAVYAKMKSNDRKVKFDITDDLLTKIRKNST